MALVEFEPKISACERLQTYALDRAATGTGFKVGTESVNWKGERNESTWR
jgi:hypothetical protein